MSKIKEVPQEVISLLRYSGLKTSSVDDLYLETFSVCLPSENTFMGQSSKFSLTLLWSCHVPSAEEDIKETDHRKNTLNIRIKGCGKS